MHVIGSTIPDIVERRSDELLEQWVHEQMNAATLRLDLLSELDLENQSREFVEHFRRGLQSVAAEGRDDGATSFDDPAWDPLKALLERVSSSRAFSGFTPSETATFVLSVKQPLFALLREELTEDPEELTLDVIRTTFLVDQIALYTTEVFQRSREEIILRQQLDLLELSTPVIQLWEGVVAMPLIGTLDSSRTQKATESLLAEIVRTGATVAILDITGVGTVDTLVAQHLLRTVAAARLIGADCIISGIRPQIAQTIVQLSIDLRGVTTKATLADALQEALRASATRAPAATPAA